MFGSNRPKLKLEKTTYDKFLIALGCFLLLLTWGLAIYGMLCSPDTIPIHFNAYGEPDAYGDKTNFLIEPIMSTLLYFGIVYLNKFPHVFNYPVKITKENARTNYRIAIRMMHWLAIGLAFLFLLIVIETIIIVQTEKAGLGFWFVPLVFIVTLLPLIIGLVKMNRH